MTSSTTRAFVAKKPFATASAFMAKTTQLLSNVKRLRFLIVMLLSLCSMSMWGADYELVTSNSDLSDGDKVIIATKTNNVPSSGVTGGTVQSSTSTRKDATVSSTESNWMQFTVAKTTEGWYLSNASSQYIGKPTENTFYLTEATDCKGVCSVDSNGVLCCNSRYLQKNSSYYRMYSSINNSYTPFYVWKVTASCTAISPTLTYSPSTLDIGETTSPTLTGNTGNGAVTYSSNNTSVATVDASTGVVTAVSAGTATITANIAANGDYCSGSATTTITVNKQSATITLSEAGVTTSVTGMYVGYSYKLPSSTSQSCGDKTFVGWSTTTITNSATKPTTNFYEPGAYVTLAANQTFYAVFADKSGSGGSSLSLAETFYTNTGVTGTDQTTGIVATGNINQKNGNNEINCIGLTSAKNNTFTFSGINTSNYTSVTLIFDHKIGKYTNYPTLTISCGSFNKTITGTTGKYITAQYDDFPIGKNLTLTFTISAASGNNYSQTYLDNISLIGYKATTTYSNYTTSCSTETSR